MSIAITDSNRDIILAALRNLQRDLANGSDLSEMGDIVSDGNLTQEFIDHLCDAVNPSSNGDFESYSMLVISTAHIREEDAQRFENVERLDDPRYRVHLTGYGYRVRLHQDLYQDELAELGLSEAVWNVLRFALARGYGGVEFDCDADIRDELPQFDW